MYAIRSYYGHLHADHVGGLEWLGFSTYFNPNVESPDLFVADDLADPLWDHCLSGGMTSLQGARADLTTFFVITSYSIHYTKLYD